MPRRLLRISHQRHRERERQCESFGEHERMIRVHRDDLPLATPSRERDARALFPLEITPDEYAALHAHEWYCFSFDDVRYADPELDRWIQRLGDILFKRNGAPSVDDLRARYQNPKNANSSEL